jgi:pyruvate formate lyase activating enzyme
MLVILFLRGAALKQYRKYISLFALIIMFILSNLFLQQIRVGGFLHFLIPSASAISSATAPWEYSALKEAMYYKRLDNKNIQCILCFRKCTIVPGQRGFCKNRENRDGTLYSVVYGRPSAIHIDPIEKEPQYHFMPGTKILCVGTAGCNFKCKHCHNWHLSQQSIEQIRHYDLSPEKLIEAALKNNIPTISFTYNDPIVFYEYVYDTARLAKKNNLKIIWHSNGSMEQGPLEELLKYTDGVTIDLKGFSEAAYNNSQAQLEPVLETLKIIKKHGVWLEIVALLIPTINDSAEEIKRMCEWIRDNLGAEVPLHFSRFHPNYKLRNIAPTPVNTLELAHEIAGRAGLEYVSIGNVPGHKYNSTFCASCKKKLIHRSHFNVYSNNIRDGKCKFCGHKIPGVWK